MNGVTSINGVIFAKDSMNNDGGLLIGTLASGTSFYGDTSVMIGLNIDNSAIDAVGIGNNIKLTGDGSVAIGYGAEAMSNMAMYPTAIGFSARAIGDEVVAIGGSSYAVHEFSVALGDDSSTSAENQVSFGHKDGDKYGDGGRDTYGSDLFRSLVNVADIEMHGALTGVTGIDGVTVSGTDASTGLTVGGNAVIGKTDTPFSSTGFAVAKDGAVTAKTVNGATITGTGFNGVTLSTDGKVNGAVITSNSFNGVTLEKGADSHYKVGGVDVTKMQTDVAGKADAATTLTGYGITDAYTKTETDTAVGKKADKATTLTGYGIADAYTKTETDTAIGKKADKATTLTGYGIADAYTKTETDTAIGKKADKATTLTGYGITDAYTKTAADAKITAATADMATKTQVTADIGTAKTALESAYQAADTALGSRSAALETKTAKFNTAGDNLTGMANITSTAATLGGVGFASAGVMTGVSSIDGIAIDTSRNLSKAGTYNGVTVAAAGISGTSVFNGAAITNNSFNGVTLEKGADNHYKVGGVDVSALKTTVDSISADGVGTADTAGIKRDTTGTATTTIETNTAISSSGITTNKATVSGATATTLENGKLTVGAATVQNTGFAVGSSSLNNGSLTVDGNNKLTTAGLTASKVTVGAVTVSGGKVSGLTDAALSAVSTEAVTGKQLNATNTTVSALDTAYQAADTQIRTDFAAADTALKTELNTAIDEKAKKATDLAGYGITDAYTKTAADEKITAATADMATKTQVTADIGTAKTALESAYQAADTALGSRSAALETKTAKFNTAGDNLTGMANITSTAATLGGGGSSANTSGIHKPDGDTTTIEGNTSITTDGIDTNKVNASDSIVVADGEKNKTVISKDGILVAEGEKNQVKINEDGIHVGKNSSVVNDTDGFITDKGLYIGVSSSSDTSTAKFSVAPNGNLSSKAGDYGFSNTSADGAKFTHSGDTAYGTGSQLDTTIQGNKVTTGRIDTDELYVDGNKVTVAGGTISQTDAVNNHLSGADADGNTVTNDFKTSAVNGTTQAAEKTSADGKESTKTVNNTSAGGTGVTTSKTTTDSKDNVTVKESSFGTNEKGMTLSTSNKVTDKDGKVTKDTSGTTTMTGDSISVSKTTTTTEKDADGNEKEVTKTSGTTIGSGEVTLKREDGSTIEVGSAIEGMQSDMRELDGRVNRMGVEIKEVGALSAALAGLHPQPENANSRADFAMAMGSYEGKQALAVGGF